MTVKNRFILSVALFCLLLFPMKTYASSEASESTVKKEPVVDIEIREYMLQDGETVPFEDQYDLLPGQNVSKIVRIYNLGDECYLRVKYSFDELGEYLNDSVYGISDKWAYYPDDGRWYYTETLKNGEYAQFFEGFTVPDDFPEELSEADFSITVEAEAAADYTYTPSVRVTNGPKTGVYDMIPFWIAVISAGICVLIAAGAAINNYRNGRREEL